MGKTLVQDFDLSHHPSRECK